jgi:hypothetical protein
VARGASAGFFARVFNLDIAVKQGIAQRLAGRRIDHCAFRAQQSMG